MSKFLTPLVVEKVDGTEDTWKLHEELVYKSDIGGMLDIPEGFTTDFASIPQVFWILMPKSGEYDGAAVVHDFLYQNHTFKQKICDDILLEAMVVLGVSWWKRSLIYSGVRIGGWAFYNRKILR